MIHLWLSLAGRCLSLSPGIVWISRPLQTSLLPYAHRGSTRLYIHKHWIFLLILSSQGRTYSPAALAPLLNELTNQSTPFMVLPFRVGKWRLSVKAFLHLSSLHVALRLILLFLRSLVGLASLGFQVVPEQLGGTADFGDFLSVNHFLGYLREANRYTRI